MMLGLGLSAPQLALQRPSDGGLDLDFLSGSMPAGLTFARAGTASYFDVAGVMQQAAANVPRFEYDPVSHAAKGLLMEESRTNGFLYSQDFSNAAWTKNRLTLTPNAIAAPDGTMTGSKITETAETSTKVCQQSQTFAAGPQTVTIYAKAGERTWIYLGVSNSGTFAAHFNLSNGTVGTTAGTVTTSITNVGGGWYRCSLTWTAVAGSGTVFYRICSADNTSSYTGDGVSGLYIWGAQNEAGGFATSYIATTTAAVTRAADTLDSVGAHFLGWFNKPSGTFVLELSWFQTGKSTCGLYIQRAGLAPRHQVTVGSTGIPGYAAVDDVGTVGVTGISSGSVAVNTVTKLAVGYSDNDFKFVRDYGTIQTDTSGLVPLTVDVARFGSGGPGALNGHLRRFRAWGARFDDTAFRELTAA